MHVLEMTQVIIQIQFVFSLATSLDRCVIDCVSVCSSVCCSWQLFVQIAGISLSCIATAVLLCTYVRVRVCFCLSLSRLSWVCSAFRDFDKRRDIALARSVITENFYMWYAIVIDPLSTLTPNRALSLAFTGIASALRYVSSLFFGCSFVFLSSFVLFILCVFQNARAVSVRNAQTLSHTRVRAGRLSR